MRHEYRYRDKKLLRKALYCFLGGMAFIAGVPFGGNPVLLLFIGVPPIVVSLILLLSDPTCLITGKELSVHNFLGVRKVRIRLGDISSVSPSQVVMSFGMIYFLQVELTSGKAEQIMGFSKDTINKMASTLQKVNPEILVESQITPNNWLESAKNPPGT